MHINLFKTLLCLILSISVIYTQDKINIGESHKINSEFLKEERTVLIHLPTNYKKDSDKKYPVIYTLDGATHFKHIVGTVDWLSESSAIIPEHIVVAINNTDRFRDLSTSKIEGNTRAGGADKFLSFISKELIPYVNKNYKTNSFKTLVGHSFAGLFTIHTMVMHRKLFNAYIAMTPFLIYNNSELVKRVDKELKKNNSLPSFLYMTLGNEPRITKAYSELKTIFKERKPSDFIWESHVYENETHMSVPSRTFHNALHSLSYYAGWRIKVEDMIKGKDYVTQLIEEKSTIFNEKVKPIEFDFQNKINVLTENKKFDHALKASESFLHFYPESPWAYSSLGSTYNSLKNKEKAIQYSKEAVRIAESTNHQALRRFKTLLKRINESN